MRTYGGGRRGMVVLTSMLCIWGAFTYACSVEDENPGNAPRRTDSGVDPGKVDPQGNDAALGAPVCGKVGGYEKVKEIAAAIVSRAGTDCRISTPFANMSEQDSAHFQQCFAVMVGGAFQCPGVSYVANTTALPDGHKCRDMTRAHQGLNLRNADFNAFLEAVAAELTAAGLTQDEVRAVAPVFEGSRTGVVQQNNQPTRNTYCACEDGLYNGQPCLPEAGVIIVDAGNDVNDAGNDADGS